MNAQQTKYTAVRFEIGGNEHGEFIAHIISVLSADSYVDARDKLEEDLTKDPYKYPRLDLFSHWANQGRPVRYGNVIVDEVGECYYNVYSYRWTVLTRELLQQYGTLLQETADYAAYSLPNYPNMVFTCQFYTDSSEWLINGLDLADWQPMNMLEAA